MTAGPVPAATAAPDGEPGRWGAFSYPNYRRFWFASLVRVFGMQFHIFAAGWLVVSVLDRSPIWLGLVGFSQAVPTIVLSVPAGVLADRMEHRRLLLASQSLMAVNYLALATLIMTGLVNIWLVIGWAIIAGSLSALGNPAQQAILPRLIDMRAIASAVAFNSAIWNSMRIVGPASAGVLIAIIGVGQAFLVAAIAFAVSVVLIARLRLSAMPARRPDADNSLLGGLRYIAKHRLFLTIVGLSFFSSLFGMSYQFLMPIFADDILEVGEVGLGVMGAAAGIGALLGTIAVAKVGAGRYRGQVMIASATLFGLLVAGFAASTWLPMSLVFLFGAGFVSSLYLNVGMTTLQILVPDDLRGRVMGVWSMTWFLTSVGAFVVGAGAEVLGTPLTVALGGLSVSVFAVVLYLISPELSRLPDTREEREPAAVGGEAPARGS
ncbi:MAG: MFS transporter [Dehalococcoidia bacterium]|nr:MFS transporter [Dehalococcoidia bacterium]